MGDHFGNGEECSSSSFVTFSRVNEILEGSNQEEINQNAVDLVQTVLDSPKAKKKKLKKKGSGRRHLRRWEDKGGVP